MHTCQNPTTASIAKAAATAKEAEAGIAALSPINNNYQSPSEGTPNVRGRYVTSIQARTTLVCMYVYISLSHTYVALVKERRM